MTIVYYTLRRATGTLARMLALASLTSLAAHGFVADFSSATLDSNFTVNQWDGNGHYLPGTLSNWAVASGDGALRISLAPGGSPYLSDGPHVQTRTSTVTLNGDFVATVTVDRSANDGASAGFFLDTPGGGYAGIGFYSGVVGFNSSYATPVQLPTDLSTATFQLVRTGTTLTARFKAPGAAQYTDIATVSDSAVAGVAWFDLTNFAYAGPSWSNPISVAFTNFSAIAPAPPVLSLPADITAEATSAAGAVVSFAATAQDDIDGSVPVSYSMAPDSVFPIGTTVVTVMTSDHRGTVSSGAFSITVRDTTSPTITRLSVTPDMLWPANKKMVPVTLSLNAIDLVGVTEAKIVSVTSNEPDGTPQWRVTGDLSLLLKADRLGGRSGRIYTITVEARDAAGNAAQKDVTVVVPHDRGTR